MISIKSFLILFITILTFTGCGSGESESSADSSDFATQSDTADQLLALIPLCENGPASINGQVTDSKTSEGIANVVVSYGSCTASTDSEGYYTLSNVVTSERAVLNFSHQGYYRNSSIIQIDHYLEDTTTLSPNYLEYAFDAFDAQSIYNTQESTIIDATNAATITLSAAEYRTAGGDNYIGDVIAEAAYLNVTTDIDREAFPGAYEGITSADSIVPFVSYGAIALELKDNNGNTLDFSGNAILTFPSLGLSEHNIIPLWFYDYNQGVWIEEGFAELQQDGTYKGEVSHIGTWSLNVPVENAPGTYLARIVYGDGTPVKDARVHTIGTNWIRTCLSTDADGMFQIEVIPESSFQLKAYNYKDKYEAVYDGTIPAIASGEIVEDRM
ncbi:MAG: hypothetical protein U9Q62_04230 [Campylobacterota bacterium]|nr:hypothetical protein [Campylobacterota bacterium]